MTRNLSAWGADCYAVLVSAFCRNELFIALPTTFGFQAYKNFVSVENRDPHATSVRSPNKIGAAQ